MNELIQSLSLMIYLVIYVLLIVLIGILITEYFKRTKKNKKGIPLLIVILGVVISLAFIDSYRRLFGYGGFDKLIIILNICAISLLGISLYKLWSHINKKIFFTMFFLAIITTVLFLFTHISPYIMILHIIIIGILVTFFYFFIIDFLINTSGGKHE
jgi:membrane protein YdbS with pleckstrin-like domain